MKEELHERSVSSLPCHVSLISFAIPWHDQREWRGMGRMILCESRVVWRASERSPEVTERGTECDSENHPLRVTLVSSLSFLHFVTREERVTRWREVRYGMVLLPVPSLLASCHPYLTSLPRYAHPFACGSARSARSDKGWAEGRTDRWNEGWTQPGKEPTCQGLFLLTGLSHLTSVSCHSLHSWTRPIRRWGGVKKGVRVMVWGTGWVSTCLFPFPSSDVDPTRPSPSPQGEWPHHLYLIVNHSLLPKDVVIPSCISFTSYPFRFSTSLRYATLGYGTGKVNGERVSMLRKGGCVTSEGMTEWDTVRHTQPSSLRSPYSLRSLGVSLRSSPSVPSFTRLTPDTRGEECGKW